MTIQIADYDPAWPQKFRVEAAKILAALGAAAMRIEHVGSTAVPGLPAKRIIDVVLVVQDSTKESAYVPSLEAAGYRFHHREPHWFEHRMLKGLDPSVNLHVFTEGCPEIDKMLAFRDWLRAHSDDRDRYARTKRDLASREWKDSQDYADAKTPVIVEISSRGTAYLPTM